MLFSHTHNENPIKYQWWEEVKQEEASSNGGSSAHVTVYIYTESYKEGGK